MTPLEKLCEAWKGYPGRTGAEAEFNGWLLRVNNAIKQLVAANVSGGSGGNASTQDREERINESR